MDEQGYHAVSLDYISPSYLQGNILGYFLHRGFQQTALAKLFYVIWGDFTSLDWAKQPK